MNMKLKSLALGALFILNAHATSLFNYAVYTKKGIHAECSDFLGKTGSNAQIILRDFLIQENNTKNCPLESSSTVRMIRGGVVTNDMQFSCVRTQNLMTESTGTIEAKTYGVRFKLYDRQMDEASALLNAGNIADSDSLVLDSATFTYKKNIVLSGSSTKTLIITIKGEKVKINGMGITLVGDIGPQNIIWHFPEATVIELSYSGMKLLGIPGTILAPNARLIMNNALVTGAIYVKEFVGLADRADCSNRVSGQVNPMCLRSLIPTLGCKDSE
jgi:choice-of-anchor A domain-containing protein